MEIGKDFFDAVRSRTVSPVYGNVFLFSFLVNWKPLVYVAFSDTALTNRFKYFDAQTSWWSLIGLPVLLAILYAVGSPFVLYSFRWVTGRIEDEIVTQKDKRWEHTEISRHLAVGRVEAEKAERLRVREDAVISSAKADAAIEALPGDQKAAAKENLAKERLFIAAPDRDWDKFAEEIGTLAREFVIAASNSGGRTLQVHNTLDATFISSGDYQNRMGPGDAPSVHMRINRLIKEGLFRELTGEVFQLTDLGLNFARYIRERYPSAAGARTRFDDP
ncbi:hypothetical protein [Thioclava sp. GXIMD4215]|uniref:hypothetical protein n=1 Tax=Thioclava sp. GXIMD4215 TaxID=3131928 RepID=UPI003249CB8E